MWLTYQVRIHADAPADHYLQEQEIEILQAIGTKKIVTIQQAVLVLASLVGFSPSKKQPLPGLKVFWQAWKAFQRIKQGYNSNKNNYGT